jgi:hypothetical protein
VEARQNVRALAMAFGVGALIALFVDAALRNALAAIKSPGVSSHTPWWVVGLVIERSVWIAAALFAWLLAPVASRITSRLWRAGHVVSRSAALDVVGRAMVGLPLLWLLATWFVLAAKVTLDGGWSSEGRVFLSVDYYANILLAYTPWAAGGVTLLTLRRHTAD